MNPATAPIAIFAYKRPAHARRLLQSLAANPEFAHSPVYVFCDGPRNETDREPVEETRRVVRTFAPAGAKIVAQAENLGLSRSVIGGVGQVCAAHGRAIVLEDDLIVAPSLLRFFNAALDHYAAEERVMHVSGYVFPTGAPLPETFFYRAASCWGWATWQRAWRHFQPDGSLLLEQLRSRRLLGAFDIDDTYPYTAMLEGQIAGRNDSWAVRWHGSVLLQGGLCLHPGRTLVVNDGFDGSGEHCRAESCFGSEFGGDVGHAFPAAVAEDPRALAEIRRFFAAQGFKPARRQPVFSRLRRRLGFSVRVTGA
jgi:hypothetical protein